MAGGKGKDDGTKGNPVDWGRTKKPFTTEKPRWRRLSAAAARRRKRRRGQTLT
jgi:hypothetical protein